MQTSDIPWYLAKSHPHVVLVAVTKKRPISAIIPLLSQGISHIGESYIQEAKPKFQKLSQLGLYTYEKHFIGHLQSRKAYEAVELFDMIQSVDSIKLIEKIDQAAKEVEKKQRILLQLNLTWEPNKHGFIGNVDELGEMIDFAQSRDHIILEWLMCMGKQDDKDATRSAFQKLRKLTTQLGLTHCSMGMSDDWEIALEEGSTMLRIGSALFGD